MRIRWSALLLVASCHRPHAITASPVTVPDAPIVGRVEVHGPAPRIDPDDAGRSKAIAAVGPKSVGKRGLADTGAQPFVHFTRPMQPDPAALHFEFEPKVHGETVFVDPYRAYFSGNDFELGRHYAVHVRGTLRRDDGTEVTIDERWSFDTRPPVLGLELDPSAVQWATEPAAPSLADAAAGVEPPEPTVHWRTGLGVESELLVKAKALRRHVTARAWPVGSSEEAARPVAIQLFEGAGNHGLPDDFEWSNGGIHIHPATHWPANHHVEVTVDGAFAPRGAGPIGAAVRRRFRVSAGTPVDVTCGQDFGDGCGPGGIDVNFAMPMAARDLARVRVTPRPRDFEVVVHGDRSLSIYGDFVIDRTYRVDIPKGLRDKVGQAIVGELKRSLTFVPPPPAVDLVVDSGVLRPGLPATVGLESRWVRKALLRAGVPSERAWIDLQGRDLDETPFPSDTTRLVEREIDLAPGGRYAWSSIALDVAALAGAKRPLVVEVVPLEVMDVAAHRRPPKTSRGLYQLTDHGLAVWRSAAGSRVQVRDNASLEPQPGVAVEIQDTTGKVVHRRVTDREGFAELLPDRALPERATLVARSSDGIALAQIGEAAVPAHEDWRDRGEDRWISEVVTERALYRPGETVSVVGWAAVSTTRSAHGLLRPKAGAPVELEIVDHRNDVVARRKVAVTAHGKYWARLPLPAHIGLGRYEVRAKLPERGRGLAHMKEATVSSDFEVRDVEVPEFEVRTTMPDANLVRPEAGEIVAHAGYFFGGPVPIKQQRATTRCNRAHVTVPGIDRSWQTLRAEFPADRWSWPLDTTATDGPPGEVRYRIETKDLPPGVDLACETDLAIGDASFTEVGATQGWYVHPSRYVVVHSTVGRTTYAVDARAVDADGEVRVVQPVGVEIARYEQRRDAKGNLDDVPIRVHRCALDTTATGADARCAPGTLAEGRYRASFTTKIDGVVATHEEQFWISAPSKARVSHEPTSLELRVESTHAQPGGRLKVEMVAPKVSGPGVLSFSHGGLRRLIPFELKNGAASLELAVTDAWVPAVQLEAFVVTKGESERAPPRTWRDGIGITVGPEHRRLAVTLAAPTVAGAGDPVSIEVRVAGSKGEPVDGRVALWAVDEAIHAMVPPRIPDFVATFAQGRRVNDAFFETFSDVLRPYTVRDDPFEGGTYGHGSGAGFGSGSGRGFGGRGAVGAAPVRRRFEATPIFVGDAAVKDGRAVVEGRMPENLSTFRVTAIASAEVEAGPGLGRFGHGDARIQLTAPLVVRPAMPRMLRPGDTSELAVLVDNLAGGDGTLSLEVEIVRGAELIEIVRTPPSTIELSAGAQERFPFSVKARAAGTVELELRAELRGKTIVRDAMRTSFPIEVPDALRRHAAAYGSATADGAFAIALARPDDAPAGALAVEVELAGTMLSDLQPLARDLVKYPYGCVEQTTSGLLPLVALGSLGRQGYLDVDVREHIDVGVARLRAMQIDNRGLGYWPGASRTHVWGTAYALWVLEMLHASGHPVPASLRGGLRDDLAARLGGSAAVENTVIELDDVAATMAVQALVASGARPIATIDRLFAARDGLPTFARALLLMAAHGIDPTGAIARTLASDLRAQLDERAGSASVRPGTTYYEEYFDSTARTDAMVMLALGRVDPDDPVLEKLARGLAIHRSEGRIANTQERAYTMLALAEYARHREKDVPKLAATVWMAGEPTAPAKLEGRTPAAVRRTATLTATTGEPKVTVVRTGTGRLYYRVGMSWIPRDAGKTADVHGFALERTLRTESGAGAAITAGDLVAMDVVVTVDRMQRYVAVEVPLPPGLEPVDTSLGKGRRARVLAGGRSSWVSHQELRKDRAVLFADGLSPGTHRTTVFLRAIAAGSYAMPPAEAHAMYTPELRGHTARARVDIAQRP